MSTRTLHEIAVTLPDCYDLSSTIRKAEKEPNPRACGGSCDVTLGTISLAEMKGKHQLLSACTPGTTALKVAIKRARAWDFDKWSEDKQTAFIKVLCLSWFHSISLFSKTSRYRRDMPGKSRSGLTSIIPISFAFWDVHTKNTIFHLWSHLGWKMGQRNSTYRRTHLRTNWFWWAPIVEIRLLIVPFMLSRFTNEDIGCNQRTFLSPLERHHSRRYESCTSLFSSRVQSFDVLICSKENILISKAGTALLADFGVSRDTVSSDYAYLDTSSHNINGTLNWMAIEQLQATRPEERYSFATDIWSFGMTIYVSVHSSHLQWTLLLTPFVQEFLTGNIPFNHINWTLGVLRAIMDCNSPHGPEDPSFNSEQEEGLWNICKLCWHADPKDRPTAIALKGLLGTVPVQCLPRPETEHSPVGKSKQEKLNEIYATIARWKGEYAREHDNCPMTPIKISESDKDQFNSIFKSLAGLADIIEKSLPFVPSLRKDVNTMELLISFVSPIDNLLNDYSSSFFCSSAMLPCSGNSSSPRHPFTYLTSATWRSFTTTSCGSTP